MASRIPRLRMRDNLPAIGSRLPVEVGSPTPRGWASREEIGDGGGTERSRRGLSEATSNKPDLLPVEVGSPTPRGWASREEIGNGGGTERSRRGLSEATSNKPDLIPVEVGSPTPRGWTSREDIGERRRKIIAWEAATPPTA